MSGSRSPAVCISRFARNIRPLITLLAAATWRPKLEGNGRPAAAHARYFLARLSCPQAAPRAKRDGFKELNNCELNSEVLLNAI